MDTATTTISSLLHNATKEFSHKVHKQNVTFSWYDYAMFIGLLLISSMIGVYFGFFGKKQNNATEYLLGGKNMGVFPISMSLISSLISGVTLLAVPADVYSYGHVYIVSIFAYIITSFIVIKAYLPVFFKCEITSTFEYLELRFNKTLRNMCSPIYITSMLLYLSIVIFIPALALSQATGINIHYITPVLCSICIFYTCLGGLKAVAWTDTIQLCAMVGAIIAIVCIGSYKVGGVGHVLDVSSIGDRLTFDFDLSPLKRDTFWSVLIGLTINWISSVGIAQGSVQKFMSLGSLSKVKWTMLVFSLGITCITSGCVYCGLLIYATYSKCDLIESKQVARPDQMLPYYVLDIAADIPGLAGIFIAGLVSASLSTLSASMHAVTGILYEDFVSPFLSKTTSPKKIGYILKGLVFATGITSTLLVFVIENLGGILPLVIFFGSLNIGPLTGVFSVGMLVPSVNTTGAMAGLITSFLAIAWMGFGSMYYKTIGAITYPTKPMSTAGCDGFVNATVSQIYSTTHNIQIEEPFLLYQVSAWYYTIIGTIIVFLVAIPVSYFISKKDDKSTNMEYISPVMHWLYADKEYMLVNQVTVQS